MLSERNIEWLDLSEKNPMTAEEMFDLLDKRHFGSFTWRMLPFSNHEFVNELRKELQIDDPIRTNKVLYSVAKKDNSNDVLFLIGSQDGQDIYRIYHLTFSAPNPQGYPKYREFGGTGCVMAFLEAEYLAETIDEYKYLWEDEKDDWGLVLSSGEYSIVNLHTQSVLLMEDEYLNNAIVSRMKEHDCTVFANIQELNTLTSNH